MVMWFYSLEPIIVGLTQVALGIVVVEIKRFRFIMLFQKTTFLKCSVTLWVEVPLGKSPPCYVSHHLAKLHRLL